MSASTEFTENHEPAEWARRVMVSDWLPTARALAAVWTGPALVQHTVSEGEPQKSCGQCVIVLQEDEDGCPECGAEDWQISTSYPDADTVPDLTSAANGGVLSVALGGTWTLTTPEAHATGLWSLERWYRPLDVHSKHFAHAVALAFLASN